ncbi:conserved hypothetical protein [Agrobacterium fabacearum CFBP 5771]|nr:conserved hypothetical protein [Agrobacterium fabacearum CFBP 5771]
MRKQQRMILDSNLWRYISDAGASGRLLRVARHGNVAIQIAPAVMYEALRLRDTSLRRRLVELMSNRAFQRLMPEAYSESMEILDEIKRLHPDWIKTSPELEFFKRSRNDWSRKMGGFWVRCATDPDREASFIADFEGSLLEEAGRQIRDARKEMMELGWKKDQRLDEIRASPPKRWQGWNGEPVEAWRLETLVGVTYALQRPGHPYRDWLAPFIEIDGGLLRSPPWVEFWLHAVERNALPRQCLRWGHSFSQRFRKVTTGSGGDNQLITYLMDTDCVMTADKGFVDIIEACRPYAPHPLPATKLVAGGLTGAETVLEHLETMGPPPEESAGARHKTPFRPQLPRS